MTVPSKRPPRLDPHYALVFWQYPIAGVDPGVDMARAPSLSHNGQLNNRKSTSF